MSSCARQTVLVAVPLCGALVLAWLGGSLASEPGAFEDEPAHVATALMIHDWLATGASLDPRAFAQDFYLHHPKVALGQWPPVLHGALALWSLVLGASSVVFALFGWCVLAAVGALVAVTVAHELRHDAVSPADEPAATGLGAAAGLVTVALPLVQQLAGAVMTEVPLALLGMLAALAFGRWMEAPSTKRALVFGLLAVSAILTKGSGLALALVPGLALLLARQPRLALRPSLWLAPLFVAALAAPWYALSLPLVRTTWSDGASPSLDYAHRALRFYSGALAGLGGFGLLALAVIGGMQRLARRAVSPQAAALGAWLLGLGVVYTLVPTGLEPRHLVVVAPALVVFAACGAQVVVRGLLCIGAVRLATARSAAVAGAGLVIVPFGTERFELVHKDCHGYTAAAEVVLCDAEYRGDTVLVASGSTGEGLGVLAFALGEAPRRSRQVLRASKVLASASWIGADYSTRFTSPEAVREWLASVPVAAVLLDGATPTRHEREHLVQLRAALEGDAGTWQLARRIDVERDGQVFPGALEVWLAPDHARRPPRNLGFDEVLGRAPPTP